MRWADIVTGLVVLGLSALAVYGTADQAYWADFAPGPAFAPRLVAAAGAVLAVLLIVAALRGADDKPVDWPDPEGGRRVLLALVGLWAFLFVIPWTGFILAAVVFALFALIVIQRRALVPSLIATAVTVGLVVAVFQYWLQIALPKGVLGI